MPSLPSESVIKNKGRGKGEDFKLLFFGKDYEGHVASEGGMKKTSLDFLFLEAEGVIKRISTFFSAENLLVMKLVF